MPPPSPAESARGAAVDDVERVGILGGTFDPIHVGHVVAACEVRGVLALDRMLLVVAGDPWQKAGGVVAPAAARLAMVQAVAEEVDGVETCDLEVRRPGPTFTADTVAELAGPGRRLYLVVGSDVARRLAGWDRVDELRARVRLVVVSRHGERGPDPGPGWRTQHVVIPRLDVSSTQIRDRLEAGRPVDGLVPAAALRVLRARALYTRSDRGPRT